MKPFALLLSALIPVAGQANPPEGLWLTEDQSVIIASGACEDGGATLCAILVGLKDETYAKWADDLCGLPIFWGLRAGTGQGRWESGKLLDPVTERIEALSVELRGPEMVLTGADGTSMIWRETQEQPTGCEDN